MSDPWDDDARRAVRNCARFLRGAFVVALAFAWGFALGERNALLDEHARLTEQARALEARNKLTVEACWAKIDRLRAAGCRNCEHLDPRAPWGWICVSCGRSSVPR